jgi:hypothetical protein
MYLKLKIFVFFVFLALINSEDAQAYINPGTGSYFFQVLISFFMGIVFFFKNIFKLVKKCLGLKVESESEEINNDEK